MGRHTGMTAAYACLRRSLRQSGFSECRCAFQLSLISSRRKRVCPEPQRIGEWPEGLPKGAKETGFVPPHSRFRPFYNPKFIQLKSFGFLSEMFRR
jgi:hypothetical protein